MAVVQTVVSITPVNQMAAAQTPVERMVVGQTLVVRTPPTITPVALMTVPLADLVAGEAQVVAPLGSPHSVMRRPGVVMAVLRARVVERMAVGRARAVRAAVAIALVVQAAQALVALAAADRPRLRARVVARMAVVQTPALRTVEALAA
jgi:hypothetical protein